MLQIPEHYPVKLHTMRPERKLRMDEVLDKRQPDLVIVMENVEDPHNIGAVMRTADSVGVQEIYVINTLINPNEFRGKRSTGSAEKWLTVKHFDSVADCVTTIKNKGMQLWATHLGSEAKSLYDLDLVQPVALAFGSERKGISEALLRHCDGNFIIPQAGMINSLNISVACAVSLYEAMRQRLTHGMYNGECRFTAADRNTIYTEWTEVYREK